MHHNNPSSRPHVRAGTGNCCRDYLPRLLDHCLKVLILSQSVCCISSLSSVILSCSCSAESALSPQETIHTNAPHIHHLSLSLSLSLTLSLSFSLFLFLHSLSHSLPSLCSMLGLCRRSACNKGWFHYSYTEPHTSYRQQGHFLPSRGPPSPTG